MEKRETIFCPVNSWNCYYWKQGGICTIDNPMDECEDYYAMNGVWL